METITSLNGILEFVYTAQYNGFSQAAKILGVSKSHISKQIARLEDELQVRLLYRTTRQLSLTDAGKILFEKCSHLLDQLSDVRHEITKMQLGPSGTLKVSVAGALAENYLAGIFAEFLKKHTKINIELSFSNRVVDLVGENFDLAIRYGQLEDSSYIAKKLATRSEFICATPAYIKKNGAPKQPKDLIHHNCLIGQNDHWGFMINNKRKNIKISGNWKSNNGRAINVALMEGVGIAKLPGVYVFAAIQAKKLVPLLNEYRETEQNIWLVYPHRKYLSTKVKVFSEFISDYFQKKYQDIIF